MRPLIVSTLAIFVLAACPSNKPAPPPKASATKPVKAAASKPAKAAASQPAKAAASQPAKAAANGQAAAKADGPDGEHLFKRTCANCHGVDGTGAAMRSMLPKIGDLTSAELHGRMDDAAIAALITNGRGKMPPLGSVLKPEQIKAVIAYVRTLKK